MNLDEIKKLVNLKKSKDLNNLEHILMSWMESKEFISNDLSKDEIDFGLRNYLDTETYVFWKNFLNEKNVFLYCQLINEIDLVKRLITESLSNFSSCSGSLNILSNSLKVDDQMYAPIMVALKIGFNLDPLLANLVMADLKDNVNYNVTITKDGSMFNLKLAENIFSEASEVMLTSLNLLKSSLALSVVVLSLSSIDAYAQNGDMTEALKMSAKALSKTEKVSAFMEETKKTGKKEVKTFQEENPNAKVPIVIIGYGAKIIKDGGVTFKGSNDTVINDLSYKLTVGKQLKFDLNTPNPYLNNSNVGISGTPEQVQMNFDISW